MKETGFSDIGWLGNNIPCGHGRADSWRKTYFSRINIWEMIWLCTDQGWRIFVHGFSWCFFSYKKAGLITHAFCGRKIPDRPGFEPLTFDSNRVSFSKLSKPKRPYFTLAIWRFKAIFGCRFAVTFTFICGLTVRKLSRGCVKSFI